MQTLASVQMHLSSAATAVRQAMVATAAQVELAEGAVPAGLVARAVMVVMAETALRAELAATMVTDMVPAIPAGVMAALVAWAALVATVALVEPVASAEMLVPAAQLELVVQAYPERVCGSETPAPSLAVTAVQQALLGRVA